MRRAAIGLCCLAAGFALARLVPVSGGNALPASAGPESIKSKSTVGARAVAPASFSLEGDWRPQAEAWAERDPAGFCQWLVERGIPPGEEVLMVLFKAWIRQDVDAAFTAAFNLPGDFQRENPLLGMMCGWALAGPGGLKAVLKWIPQAEEQMGGWASPGFEIIQCNPPAETAAILAEMASPMKYSGTLTEHFAAFWAEKDLTAAIAWMRSLKPCLRTVAMRGIMETWAKQNPNASLDYLASEATSAERQMAYVPLGLLAKTNPKAALDWLENNIGVVDSNSLTQIFSAWNKQAAASARDYAFAIEDPALRRHALEAWGNTAKVTDFLEALDHIPAGPDRKTLLLGISQKYSSDPAQNEAIRHLVADPANTDITPAMASSVSAQFAYQEPQAALEWATTLPESLQAESAEVVMRVWKDKVAAAQAVEKLPEGPVKKAAQEALKASLNPADPFR
jgi:hypothetical protein